MSRLTIIIPALGRQKDLDDTLVSVLENRPAACEVLVPHGPAYRDPYDLSDEVRFVPTKSQDLVSLIRAGIDASQAPIVHVLQGGFQATAGWTEPVLARFASDVSLAAVAPRIQLPTNHPIRALRGIRYHRGGSRREVPVLESESHSDPTCPWEGPSLQAGFFRRCALSSIGGVDPDLGTYYCDVDTIVKLRRAGWRCDHEPTSCVAGPRTKRPSGFRAGRQAERLFWRHRRALGRITSLGVHVWIIGLESLQQFPRPASFTTLCGRIWGFVECAASRRHRWMPNPTDERTRGPLESRDPPTIPIEEARRRKQTPTKIVPTPPTARRVGS